jgi:hypothetical protein|tara:strand:+ start:903 stop:1220 length:318 start_codon:yes stop_codon:yes gene_type:complete
MAYEERLQSDGQIYTNNFKESDKQPDWTGKVTLTKEILKELVEKMRSEQANGVDMRVALWDRVSKNGNSYKYARLDVNKEQRREQQKPAPVKPKVEEFSEDDIPF